MKLKIMSAALAASVVLVAARPLAAHHSAAMFDDTKVVELSGTVKALQWTNPHVYIGLDVTDDAGVTKRWTIECANPGILNRVGWKWNMIKPGDEISVIVSPLRNGEPGALLKAVRLADGREFGNGGPAGPARISFDE